MIPVSNIDQISGKNVWDVVKNEVLEGKTLEYKRRIGDKNSDRIQLLAAISSFANASGGDLVLGVDAPKGVPLGPIGEIYDDLDLELQRLESLIRQGISPRLPSYAIKAISVGDNLTVIVIRVQRSWIGPHQVGLGHDKFYGRNTNGRYPLDVDNLRLAFRFVESFAQQVRDFRVERIATLNAAEAPVLLEPGAKALLHLVPTTAYSPGQLRPVERILDEAMAFLPVASGANLRRLNLDGVITASELEPDRSYSYTQVFRSGVIEATTVFTSLNPRMIPQSYENSVLAVLPSYLEILTMLDVPPPVFVMLTFIGVKGYIRVSGRGTLSAHAADALNRDILAFPEVVIEDFDVELESVLKPLFDISWQAWGFRRSPNYNDSGKWIGGRY